MLQKVSESRSNAKDLKDFVIKFEEIESLKNKMNINLAIIQNKTEENASLKVSLQIKKI